MTIGIDIPLAGPEIQSGPGSGDAWDRFAGAVVGIREMKTALRRRRRLWIFTAVAGFLIGASLHVVLPRSYKAIAVIYVVEPPGSTPANVLTNEVSLMQTRAVAQQAAATLPGDPTAQSVAGSYKGEALGGSIISVTAKAGSAPGAMRLDNAVADAFLAVRANVLRAQTASTIAGYQQQIADLRKTHNPFSADISGLQNAILSQELTLTASVSGSMVLDPAEPVKASVKKATVEDSLAGLIAGLAIGLGIVLIGELLSDRARRREDVAAALGVDVELSLARPSWTPWTRLLSKSQTPDGATTMLERRLRSHLESTANHCLVAFSVGAEQEGSLAVCSLAASLIRQGRRVIVLDMAQGRPLRKLFGVKDRLQTIHRLELDGRPFWLVEMPDDPAQGVDLLRPAPTDYVLVLAGVDPALGVDHIAPWATDSVVIVRAGRASHVRLNGVGRIIRQAGITIRSAILTDSDASDDSAGITETDSAPTEYMHRFEAMHGSEW